MLDIRKLGEEVLQIKAPRVEEIDERIADLAKSMRATMYEANGVGLAAPQVGESIQMAVLDITMGEDESEFMVLVNPEILEHEGRETDIEGCLSIPGISVAVPRHTSLRLHAFDLDGREIDQEIEGFKARVIQHEIDHLNGTLILDHLSSLKRQMVKKEISRLKKNGEW
jgi:peptide deformylase